MALNTHWSMKDIHRQSLLKHRLQLAREICLEEVMQYLVQERILTDRIAEKISSKPTRFARNSAFLAMLPTKGPFAFDAFVRALRACNQEHIADMLSSDIALERNANWLNKNVSKKRSKTCGRLKVCSCPCNCDESSDSPKSNKNAQDNNKNNSNNAVADKSDGPSKLFVENTTVEFYKANRSKSYKMSSKPRGLALIVSVNRFDQHTSLPERKGSEKDVKNLSALFQQLLLSVQQLNNPTGDEVRKVLGDFSRNPLHAKADCCAVAVLSHGTSDYFYAKDGVSINTQEVIRSFDNLNCPHLRNKPKIFVIQACRSPFHSGESPIANAVGVDRVTSSTCCAETRRRDVTEKRDADRMPTMSDMIIGHSSMLGSTAMRNTQHGSWYIQALVRAMATHCKDKDITEILTIVNDFVRNRVCSPSTFKDGNQQDDNGMPEFVSTLCKKLYFFPGIAEKS